MPEKRPWKGLLGASGRLSFTADAASLVACLGSSGRAASTDDAASCAASCGLLPPVSTAQFYRSRKNAKASCDCQTRAPL